MSIFTPKQVEDRIIQAFEKSFRTEVGPARAFFELPQRGGPPVRVIYVVYAAMGNSIDELHNWFFEQVVDPLITKAGGEGYLYWRHPERVLAYKSRTVVVEGVEQKEESVFKIRTRLAVLDKRLNPITIADAVKLEGMIMPTVSG